MNKFFLFTLLCILAIFSSCEKENGFMQNERNADKSQITDLETDSRSVSDALQIISDLTDLVNALYQDDLINKDQRNYLLGRFKNITKKLNQGKIEQAIAKMEEVIIWLNTSGISPEIIDEIANQLLQAQCEADPVDKDGDGYLCTEDCDDTDPTVNPGADEIPGNNVDDNCDGEVDEVIVCTEIEGYNAVSLEDIINTDKLELALDGSDNVYNEIPAGTVVVYKTNEGRFGKFLVQSIDASLLISWTTYNDDGTIFSEGADFFIPGTWNVDLDTGVLASDGANDFWWEAVDGIERYVVPLNGASFAIYSCEDTEPEECSGDFVFGGINYHDILFADLSHDLISGGDIDPQMPVDAIVVYQTDSYRVGKFIVQELGTELKITWKTYNTNGLVESEGSDLVIPGDHIVDLDQGEVDAGSASDFFWQYVNPTSRYLTPADDATFAVYNCGAN